MAKVKIRKGFDIRIAGAAEKTAVDLPNPRMVGLVPPDFRGIKVKLLKKEGDAVKAGTPVYFDKDHPEVKFASPVSGKIRHIEYGARRVIQSIAIDVDEKGESEEFRHFTAEELKTADVEELKSALLNAGLWPHLRQRPFNKIAAPDGKAKAIFISLLDTAPLAADPEFLLEGRIAEFQQGIDILGRLTDGKVHVTVKRGSALSSTLKNCEVHEFRGPHPAGNVGIHIHHVDPIRRGETVWTMAAQGVLAWAEFFLNGRYPATRLVAMAGTGLSERRYVRATEGMMIRDMVNGGTTTDDVRFISGNILTGSRRRVEGFIGFYDNLLSVIPEGRKRRFLGWIWPGLKSFSFSKTFLSALVPLKSYNLDTNTNGGLRAFVQTGIFEQVLPMDIYPDFLIRSILAEDIAEMEGLGIYEVCEEDFALCSYIDPSKNDVCGIIRHGLELIEKEG